MTKVSVIIPVYNGENYLAQAIESVLAQDYPNIEFMVCNGESTDKTQEIAESYGVRVIEGKLGTIPNWLTAMEMASGDYVKLLCHDDVLRKDCISKQVAILDDDPAVMFTTCQRHYIDADGMDKGIMYIGGNLTLPGKDIFDLMLKHGNIVGEVTCGMWRNTKFTPPADLNWLIDMYMWAELFTKGDFSYAAEPLASIRQHPAQDTFRCLRDPDYQQKEASDHRHIKAVYERGFA